MELISEYKHLDYYIYKKNPGFRGSRARRGVGGEDTSFLRCLPPQLPSYFVENEIIYIDIYNLIW